MEVWVILVVLLAGGYFVSLRRNPWVDCSRCHGKPRRRGAVFSYSHRMCSKCGGTGQQLRMGRRVLGMGAPEQSS